MVGGKELIIQGKDRFLKGIQLVEEELLFPQVEEYVENEEVIKVVDRNTETFEEYSFIVYQLGKDHFIKGTFEAVSFLDASVQLIKFLAKGFGIIRPKIVSEERYRSFVVYETNGRR